MTCHDVYPQFATATVSLTGRRIVVGVDDSLASIAALRWADQQARETGAPLEVVHVYRPWTPYGFSPVGLPPLPTVEPSRVRSGEEAALTERVHSAGVEITESVHLRAMDDPRPAHALALAAEGAALLVLGANRWPRVGVILGSTARGCLRHATCPVVFVPAPLPTDITIPAS